MLNNYKNTCMIKFYSLGGGLTSNIKQSKIATEAEAYAIGGKGTSNGNKACTNARAQALGCESVSGHSSNQLVPKSSLKADEPFIDVKVSGIMTIHYDNNQTCYDATLRFTPAIKNNSKISTIWQNPEYTKGLAGNFEGTHNTSDPNAESTEFICYQCETGHFTDTTSAKLMICGVSNHNYNIYVQH